MTKKVACRTKTKTSSLPVRVRVIKAPLVDSKDLNFVTLARSRAIVL